MSDPRGKAAAIIRHDAARMSASLIRALVAITSRRAAASAEAEGELCQAASAYAELLAHFAQHFAAADDRPGLLRAAAVAQELGALRDYERAQRRPPASRETLTGVIDQLFCHIPVAKALADAVGAEADAHFQRVAAREAKAEAKAEATPHGAQLKLF